jgi:hypothetical protein
MAWKALRQLLEARLYDPGVIADRFHGFRRDRPIGTRRGFRGRAFMALSSSAHAAARSKSGEVRSGRSKRAGASS